MSPICARKRALHGINRVAPHGALVKIPSNSGLAKGDDSLSDARTGRRFPLNLPITIREGESADQTSGTTQNVSAAGVYIRADAELEVGSQIEFEITLPSDVIGGHHDVRVKCQGRVVRRESDKTSNGGVACVIDNYKFVRGA
ncbi:MAG: hypothetical protein DMG62_06595 [Acidobacteria bacterium]|nr:MAG: hypothetical protein DMG62_06595 [Acidobacteriota bacterium]